MSSFLIIIGSIMLFFVMCYGVPLLFPKVRAFIKEELDKKDYQRSTPMQVTHIIGLAFAFIGVIAGILGASTGYEGSLNPMIFLMMLGICIRITGLFYAIYVDGISEWYKEKL